MTNDGQTTPPLRVCRWCGSRCYFKPYLLNEPPPRVIECRACEVEALKIKYAALLTLKPKDTPRHDPDTAD